MSALPIDDEVRFEAMHTGHLDAVLAVEEVAYTNPWTRGNFMDSIRVGYECQVLVGGEQLIGYYVAMKGVDEVHLLNITVAPDFQRQGWASLMLTALGGWARAQRAEWLWLEVRQSNARAQDVYLHHGFRRVGTRKGYYPAAEGREDAIVMSLRLDESPSAWGGLQR